jgi:hypothetical protein
MNCRALIFSLAILFLGTGTHVLAQERLCPDGKRSYFGVCPENGDNSRPLKPEVVPPAPKATPAPQPADSLPAPGVGLRNIAGNHPLTLHWISEYPETGNLLISAAGTPGIYKASGSHYAKENHPFCKGCWLKVEGTIVQISRSKLWFRGKIVTHNTADNGTCVRDGDYTFEATGNRKYWRMRPWFSPCNSPGYDFGPTDYVDIFF